MTGNEIAVVVIDPLPSADEDDSNHCRGRR